MREGKGKKREKKNMKERQAVSEKKTQRTEEVSFLRQCYCEAGKVDSRRERRERTEKKRRETRKKSLFVYQR